MPTQQSAIAATHIAAQVLTSDPNRRYLLIRNYSASQQTMWILFGGTAATCGTAGELELLPGYTYEFGTSRLTSPQGLVANNQTFIQPNCPTEAVNIITGALNAPADGASGCLMVVTP